MMANRVTLLSLAYQNLRRKPYRALLIGSCVALATGALFAITLILRSVQTSLAVGQARLGADIVIVPAGYAAPAQEAFITGQPSTFYFDRQVEAQVADIPGVNKVSSQVYIQTLNNASCCIGEFFLVGFDPQTDFTISPWLKTHLLDRNLSPSEVIVGDRILLRPGDGATFYGSTFTVAGVLEKTGMGMDRTVYVPIDGMRSMIAGSAQHAEKALNVLPDQISSVLVQVKPGTDIVDVAEAIENQVPGVQVFTSAQLNQAVGRQLYGMLGVLLGVTATLWLMALVMIGLVFSLVINERQRELGLLRAMGAKKSFISRLVISEAMILAAMGGLAGILSTMLLLTSFSNLLQVRLHIPYLMPGIFEIAGFGVALLALALLAGGIASVLPAISISRMEIYAAIRKGE